MNYPSLHFFFLFELLQVLITMTQIYATQPAYKLSNPRSRDFTRACSQATRDAFLIIPSKDNIIVRFKLSERLRVRGSELSFYVSVLFQNKWDCRKGFRLHRAHLTGTYNFAAILAN